nr:uncharacterized protein LOC111510262 [Leptinotarsa decemlineata]
MAIHTEIQLNDVIGNTIRMQLNTILTNMLHRQLAEAVSQFSVTELMKNKDEDLRAKAKEHSSRANKLVDSLLCTAKDYLVARNFRSIETPCFDVVYRGKLSGVCQGVMRTGTGYIQDLSTLSRPQDLSLFEDTQKLVVYGSLSLREMKHGYEHYTSYFEDTQISGSVRTTVYENKIFIKLSVQKGGEYCKTQLENVQVSTVKDIDVDASGLASLSWLVPKVESWVIGNLRYKALPVLERYIKEAFDYAIARTDCVALLFD